MKKPPKWLEFFGALDLKDLLAVFRQFGHS